MKRSLGFVIIGVFLVLACLLLSGCVGQSRSSGFVKTSPQQQLPPGIPKTVGVMPFSGDHHIATQASDQFSVGLINLGFKVVERSQIQTVLKEVNYQYSDAVDPNTRVLLRKQLGIEALFLASITGESSMMNVDTYLNIRLVNAESGHIMWSASVSDPRLMTVSMDTRTSAIHTINETLKILQKDIGIESKQSLQGTPTSGAPELQR